MDRKLHKHNKCDNWSCYSSINLISINAPLAKFTLTCHTGLDTWTKGRAMLHHQTICHIEFLTYWLAILHGQTPHMAYGVVPRWIWCVDKHDMEKAN
jgi:hypothetical protein